MTLSDHTGRKSTAQPQSDDDDVIIVDPPRPSPGKRKIGENQQNPRPPKRQMFWVEVPPHPKRKPKVTSARVEESASGSSMQATGTAPLVKEDPDQEMKEMLAAIKNASQSFDFDPS